MSSTSAKPSFLLNRITLFLIFLLLTGCSSQKTIVNGLDEKEANEILVFLASRGIDANKVQATAEGAGASSRAVLWNVSVDTARANEAMAMLNQAGLPRRRGQNLLGIFSNVGLVPSGLEQKIRYQAGLAEQIASTIRKIDGVLDADVQISFPEEDPLNPTAIKQKITASVYVKHNGALDDPNAHLITRIKRLVAGSVNGLDYDNVTVIGDRARFSEPTGTLMTTEDKQYVDVWTITLATESLTRFRIIFFSFTVALFLLTIGLAWLLWKIQPFLQEHGGWKELLHLRQLSTPEKPVEKPSKEEPKQPSNSETPPDSGVDET